MQAKGRIAQFIPSRLTEMREARGLNMSELASRLDMTRQGVSRYELGHAMPSGEALAQLSQVLECDMGFFSSKPERRIDVGGTVYFRSLQSTTRIARQVCLAKRLWFGDLLTVVERSIDLPPLNLPDPKDFYDKDGLSQAEIEDAADLARKIWAVGAGPLSDVCLLLENNGIVIARSAFKDRSIDAFSYWHNGRPIVMLASDKSSAVRSRFDAAHELGHILLHQAVGPEQLREKHVLKRLESEANRFAAAFLLPAETFARELISTTLGHFIALKRRWKVSIAAMISRCGILGILDDEQVLSLRKQLSGRKMRRVEPLDDELPPEGPRLVPRSIELLLSERVCTADDLIRQVGIPVGDLEALGGLPRGRLQNPGRIVPIEFGLKGA